VENSTLRAKTCKGTQQNEQVINMKGVVWEYMETTQLVQHNVGCKEFSVSIKAGIPTNI